MEAGILLPAAAPAEPSSLLTERLTVPVASASRVRRTSLGGIKGVVLGETPYSVPVPGSAVPGTAHAPGLSEAYRHFSCADAPKGAAPVSLDWRAASTWDLFARGLRLGPDAPCLGTRTPDGFAWRTYKETELAALRFGSGLLHADLAPQLASFPDEAYAPARNLQPVGVYMRNCAEWLLTDLAASAFGFTLVPLYDTLGAAALAYILAQTRTETIVCTADEVINIVKALEKAGTPEAGTLKAEAPTEATGKVVSPKAAANTTRLAKIAAVPHPDLSATKDAEKEKSNALEAGKAAASAAAPTSTSTASSARPLKVTTVILVRSSEKPLDAALAARLTDAGVRNVVTFEEVASLGSQRTLHPYAAAESFLARVQTICYTSGTTGTPKGVLLPHSSFVHAVQSMCLSLMSDHVFFGTSDVYLSYLPLAHIYDRQLCWAHLFVGARIGFYGGVAARLLDDAAALRPTIFASVPRFFERLTDGIQQKIAEAPRWAQALFWGAVRAHQASDIAGARSLPLVDGVVFSKPRALLGDRLRLILSGGAPLAGAVQQLLRIVYGVPVFSGYGSTELGGGAFITRAGDLAVGITGGPVPGVEFRLRSLLDMGYDATAPPPERAGELLVAAPAAMAGYFRAPGLTSEAIIMAPGGDGPPRPFIATGDVATVAADGTVRIVDRKKDIFKLSQGEYIAPEKIELAYSRAPAVSQIFVHGESTRSFLVAIVVPNEQLLAAEGHAKLSDEDLLPLLTAELAAAGAAADLKGFEKVKAFAICREPFTIDNGLLTHTLKLKRPQARAHFAAVFAELFENAAAVAAGGAA